MSVSVAGQETARLAWTTAPRTSPSCLRSSFHHREAVLDGDAQTVAAADRRPGHEWRGCLVERGVRGPVPVHGGASVIDAGSLWNDLHADVDVTRLRGRVPARLQGGDGRRRRSRQIIADCSVHVRRGTAAETVKLETEEVEDMTFV